MYTSVSKCIRSEQLHVRIPASVHVDDSEKIDQGGAQFMRTVAGNLGRFPEEKSGDQTEIYQQMYQVLDSRSHEEKRCLSWDRPRVVYH